MLDRSNWEAKDRFDELDRLIAERELSEPAREPEKLSEGAKKRKELHARIISLSLEGYSVAEIAAQVDAKYRTIEVFLYRWRKRTKINVR